MSANHDDSATMSDGEARPLAAMQPGDTFPHVTLPVTYTRVCQSAAATRDWFPGHHDPDFARSQGLSTIYVNVMFLQGLSDRAVLEWAGREARIHKRVLRMRSPLLAGRTARVAGELIHADHASCEIATTITTTDGVCAEATTVVVPRDQDWK